MNYIYFNFKWWLMLLYIVNCDKIWYVYFTDWVIQLGPPTYKGKFYQYSVVTDASNLNLFVLARNATQFKENYETTVLAKLEQQGFTKFYNKPSEIYQGDDCQYV